MTDNLNQGWAVRSSLHALFAEGSNTLTCLLPADKPQADLQWKTHLADRSTAAVKLQAEYALPPNVVFDLLADPNNHARIFDAIEVGVLAISLVSSLNMLNHMCCMRCLPHNWLWALTARVTCLKVTMKPVCLIAAKQVCT